MMRDMQRSRWLRDFGLIVALAMVLVACGAGDSGDGSEGGLSTEARASGSVNVVATTTILGDVVRNIVRDNGTVEVLLPIGADPHDYQASAHQAAALREADLVVANGLLLEEGLVDVLDAAAGDGANLLEIAERLNPIRFASDQGEAGADDPHVWLDPIRMADAARLIAAELAAIDSSVDWGARAATYAGELAEADREIQRILTAIPDQNRQLVTNHDSLGYFAERYGFELIGTVIPGGSTLADPSSAELAALVDEIERRAVPALFAETTEPSALAEAVAGESGMDIEVVELHIGSLSEPGSGADTLIGLLLTNAQRIADALS